jgi:L-2-hydroxyglutarate oxidase
LGAAAIKAFCREKRIAFEECGKLLVATSAVEMERMEALAVRASDNGIGFARLSRGQLQEREPAISGLAALLIPTTGIVDYTAICRAMIEEVREAGGDVVFSAPVHAVREDEGGVSVEAGGLAFRASRLVACAGLQSDRIARLSGLKLDHRIVPFRGEYYTLSPRLANVARHLIYPVPDPDLPFLGVHLTRMIDGSMTVGPNAVLGFDREGYPKGSVRLRDVIDTARFPGFWRVAARHWRSGAEEFLTSLSKARYLEKCRKYCPSLTLDDLVQAGAGIRAQAVTRDGELLHDFLFVGSARMLHVCSAPSPAATSSIPIGKMIVDRLHGGATSLTPVGEAA